MNTVAGLVLMESAHVPDDDTARHLRIAARIAGATDADVAEAIQLRHEWHEGHVVQVFTDGAA